MTRYKFSRWLLAVFSVCPIASVQAQQAFTVARAAGGWVRTGTMPEPHKNANSAVRLSDGTFFVAGSPQTVYDPSLGAWSSPPGSVNPWFEPYAVLLQDGRVFVFGSRLAGEIYDPISRTWAATTSSTYLHYLGTATVLQDGTVLVTGGAGPASNIVEIYDPVADVWIQPFSMAVTRNYHTATLLQDGRVLVVGGEAPFQATQSVEIYDPSLGDWYAAADMQFPRAHHAATLLLDGRVLVTGGERQPTCEIYDPSTGAWTRATDMMQDRINHTATLLDDGQVLVVGGVPGVTGWPPLSSTEIFDPTSNDWTFAGNMSIGRTFPLSALLNNGTVLVAGGTYDEECHEFVCWDLITPTAELFVP
jgi:hypothetical protein